MQHKFADGREHGARCLDLRRCCQPQQWDMVSILGLRNCSRIDFAALCDGTRALRAPPNRSQRRGRLLGERVFVQSSRHAQGWRISTENALPSSCPRRVSKLGPALVWEGTFESARLRASLRLNTNTTCLLVSEPDTQFSLFPLHPFPYLLPQRRPPPDICIRSRLPFADPHTGPE